MQKKISLSPNDDRLLTNYYNKFYGFEKDLKKSKDEMKWQETDSSGRVSFHSKGGALHANLDKKNFTKKLNEIAQKQGIVIENETQTPHFTQYLYKKRIPYGAVRNKMLQKVYNSKMPKKELQKAIFFANMI